MNRLRFMALFVAVAGLNPIGSATELVPSDDVAKTSEASETENSMAARFAGIKAEYDKALNQCLMAIDSIENQAESNKLYRKLAPDDVVFSRRMVELALTAPKTTGARDALLWVIDHPGRPDTGPFGDEFGRAAALLIRHHGDDPEAIRIGLRLDNLVSPQRDQLLYGFLAAAKTRESMGLARLSLAQYLEQKAKYTQGTRNSKARTKRIVKNFVDADGKVVDKEIEQPAESFAYILALRESNPDSLTYEAERLYQEVIDQFADVPYITILNRRLEALFKDPNPTSNGKPLTEKERQQLGEIVARKQTLGQVAEAHLDEMHNLGVGKAAPEIKGVDFDGKPLKLSDYRGKVVALVFWGTWCGPCMAEVPHERELVERLKGKPFALLGINCDEDRETAKKAMDSERITWPNWHDGAPDTGPITKLYHVRSYPTVMIIDGEGIIRHKNLHGESIDKAIDQLLINLEAGENKKP